LDGTHPSAAAVLDRLRPYLIEGALQRGMTRAVRLVGHPVDEASY
jgi:hypothetical protein